TVDSGWEPYNDGYWTYTPAGMTWVATEPWGWLPYHYGTWDLLPGYGWVWEAGNVFSPAWVYWYWGPTYVGWCPIGFYTGWYGQRFHDPSFRFGVYGWAGGSWGTFNHWTFVSTHHFGHRDLGHWARRGGDLRGDMRMAELPRGIITTDTRGITPGRLNRPQEIVDVLRNRGRGHGNDLPDVSAFVARNPNLPPQVMQSVISDRPGNRNRFVGTPLRPESLGTRPGTAGKPQSNRGLWAQRNSGGGTGAGTGRGLDVGKSRPTANPALPQGNRGDRNAWQAPGQSGEPRPRPAEHTWDRQPGQTAFSTRPERPEVADTDRNLQNRRAQEPAVQSFNRGGDRQGTGAPSWAPRERPAGQNGWDRPAQATQTPLAAPGNPSPAQGLRERPAAVNPGRPSGWGGSSAQREWTPANRVSPPNGGAQPVQRPAQWQRAEPVAPGTPSARPSPPTQRFEAPRQAPVQRSEAPRPAPSAPPHAESRPSSSSSDKHHGR
ncbi:MAG TPA: DUF6600 domain-containing protein, partial [Thermoanaerobaculia bacterium]|nr:DUF6600 domain-containing protein [Thermoanaerobaculia bacterium]